MPMTPRLRKFALTAHVTFSVGWLGAVVAYLALAIAALSSQDAQTVRAAYLSMEVIGWFVIVPLSVATLLTGLIQSLGTEWGLFRHYWVLVKFGLTVVSTAILLLHMPAVSRMSGIAEKTPVANADFGTLGIQLMVHEVLGFFWTVQLLILQARRRTISWSRPKANGSRGRSWTGDLLECA